MLELDRWCADLRGERLLSSTGGSQRLPDFFSPCSAASSVLQVMLHATGTAPSMVTLSSEVWVPAVRSALLMFQASHSPAARVANEIQYKTEVQVSLSFDI